MILILMFAVVSVDLSAQDSNEIRGWILNGRSQEPVPFANIFNQSTRKGTISNVDGYFRIAVSGPNDTIRISYIGFREQLITPSNNRQPRTIRLEESMQLLDEVTIRPDDNSKWYELIAQCRKRSAGFDRTSQSKAYYELKSFQQDRQIELVEGYYNLEASGYELADMKLKAGRIALQPFQNRYFVSIESSRALLILKLMGSNDYFPVNPMELPKAKLKRNFYVSPDRSYVSTDGDSIEVLDYKPKEHSGSFFQGKIWINRSEMFVERITMNCSRALQHPFAPLFSSDSITGVNLAITKSYRFIDGQPVFNHIDFVYVVDYKSRSGKADEQSYAMKTRAVLYAYDYGSPFLLPQFDFFKEETGDYRRIQAMPYNEFFWARNDEYRLNDSLNTNELFFNDPQSITNKTLFDPTSELGRGFFEHPFTRWSGDRIRFSDLSADTLPASESVGFKSDQYHLAAKIYVDINTYQDSTNVQTATLFDPYESYYHLPLDNQAQCFINLYFDLCEIERRELEKQLYLSEKTGTPMIEICNESRKSLEIRKNQFLKSVERGTNEREIQKYNAIVLQALGIDNVVLFRESPER